MNTDNKSAEMEARKTKLSTLWIFVMLNMVFADIFSFMNPAFQQEIVTGYAGGIQITEGLLLAFAIVLEIPMAMVLLSRILKYKTNRRANIIAGVVTIAFVIGGGSTTPHYVFFAAIEVACSLFIIRYAWQWTNPEGQPNNMALAQVAGNS